jgi:hypothetical protein
MVTKAEIRATARSLCFQACTDCASADECDPDEHWVEEARAALDLSITPHLATFANEGPDAFFVPPNAFYSSQRVQIANLAAEFRSLMRPMNMVPPNLLANERRTVIAGLGAKVPTDMRASRAVFSRITRAST